MTSEKSEEKKELNSLLAPCSFRSLDFLALKMLKVVFNSIMLHMNAFENQVNTFSI